jgi:cell division septum initiation protein DivIVA
MRTTDKLRHEIASLKAFARRHEERVKRMQEQNSGVRSSSISADIGHYMGIIEDLKQKIADLETKLKEGEQDQ